MNRAFGRRVQFDRRSRAFPVSAVAPAKPPRSYTWRCDTYLDQGAESSCVGFAWAHELAARPKVHVVDYNFARVAIYQEALKLDAWEGEDYEGTSVLAGAKVVLRMGRMKEYRWAFSLDDLIMAVGYTGPAVLGLNWYEGMYEPSAGYIKPVGDLWDGHALLCNAVSIPGRYFKLHNSWGKPWGVNGSCKISFADMDFLLHDQGEACVPIARQ